LATLAHELRNPLSPLTSAAQLIGLEPEKTDQVRELTAVMMRQLTQLVRLIDDLLDVSRISGGKLQLRKTHVPLGEPVAAALDASRPLMEEAGHKLLVSLPRNLLLIDGDPVRLTQIISNLLINAAKYTPPSGTIQLSIQAEGQQAVIRVRDSGVGIPVEMQSAIFELFAQVDSSHTRRHGGLGIGLMLVKTLVEMHGGTISVYSRGTGTGSEFTVRLPLATPPAIASPDVRQTRPDELPIVRVLVVDDSESAVHLLAMLLDKLGQEVEVAHSAEEALDKVVQFGPHLVISDVGMPEVSGLELAQRIRALTDLRQPKLVALTGYGQDSDRREILAAGFDRHFTKPMGLPELEELIAELGK
jgi:CheY-like chemotaxis protein